MATGTVKWFNPSKRYGFIEPEDGSKDVFVHASAVEKAGLPGIYEGQRLEFTIGKDVKGKPTAVDLILLD